ncbi:GMC family oxidoreductase [Brasilonema sp. CT11]|nr:GMC family oxidoreductase [Brasilonema sp. CT11]
MPHMSYSRRRFLQTATLFTAGLTASIANPLRTRATNTQNESVDALIIGSGFGGTVAALRLAQAGIHTVVLERGRRWDIQPDGNTFATFRKPDGRAAWLSPKTAFGDSVDVYTGIFERLDEDGITVLTGAGVGGGSLVYNAITYQPPRDLFYRVFPSSVSYEEMDQIYYPLVRSMLGATPIPQDILSTKYYDTVRLLLENGTKAGLPTRLLDLAVNWDIVRQELSGQKVASTILAEVWFGINSGAKNSVDHNYLPQAERSGYVEVLPLHVVTEISELARHGYQVSSNEINEKGEVIRSKTFTCRYLFLAAGSIGTSKLLVKAKAKGTLPRLSPSVGKYWGNNGDMVAQRSNLPNGVIDLGGPSGAVVENFSNTQNPISLMNLQDWTDGSGQQRCLTLGLPKPKGFFTYDQSTDAVTLHWPTSENQSNLSAAQNTYNTLDSRIATSSTTPKTEVDAGICSHPLGGAVIGKVCDEYGRVFGYEGLYVVDGAFIPGSTACTNPSFTIAALAERSMKTIIAQDITFGKYSRRQTRNQSYVY